MPLRAPELLDLSAEELDDLFRASPAGPIPAGRGDGTALLAPGTVFSKATANLARAVAWKGKVFDPVRGRASKHGWPSRRVGDPCEGVS